MKKLLLALVLLIGLQSSTAMAAPLQQVTVKNSSPCIVGFVVYAADYGMCNPMYQSIVYPVPPGGTVTVDATTITWVVPPPGPLFLFLSADVFDDGYGSCPNGTLSTSCPGGNNDICTIGNSSCGFLSTSCFIIGDVCSTCHQGTTINAACTFPFVTEMDIAVW